MKSTRIALRITQKDLATALDAHHSQIYSWESERCPIPKRLHEALQEKLKIPMTEINRLAQNWVSAKKRDKKIVPEIASGGDINLFLIMKAACDALQDASDPSLTIADILFLAETQSKLPSPMSAQLIAEILKNRHSGE